MVVMRRIVMGVTVQRRLNELVMTVIGRMMAVLVQGDRNDRDSGHGPQ
jgi:urea transporter